LPFKKISLYLRRKTQIMETYQIQINERTAFGKSILAFLQSIPQVITFKKPIEKIEEEETMLSDEALYNLAEEIKASINPNVPIITMEEIVQEVRDYRNGK